MALTGSQQAAYRLPPLPWASSAQIPPCPQAYPADSCILDHMQKVELWDGALCSRTSAPGPQAPRPSHAGCLLPGSAGSCSRRCGDLGQVQPAECSPFLNPQQPLLTPFHPILFPFPVRNLKEGQGQVRGLGLNSQCPNMTPGLQIQDEADGGLKDQGYCRWLF